MATTEAPKAPDAHARAYWHTLDAPPPRAGFDEHGNPVPVPVAPSERHAHAVRRAGIIRVTDDLAGAVVTLLRADGVMAEIDHVRIDPAAGDHEVMAVRGPSGRVAPLYPGGTTVRVYPPSGDIQLTGEPVAAVEVAAEPDGWVTAATVAAALREHLV
jgi:hypothetical protein